EQVGFYLANHLRRAQSLAISGPNTLAIGFPPSYNHSYERCQEPAQVSALEQLLRTMTGQPWKVKVELTAGADPSASLAPGAGETETALARARREKEEALKAPLLQRAVEVLGAQVVQMEDGFKGEAPPSGPRPERDAEEP